MRREVQHQWRILWTGRWKTTRYHCTEEEIRVEHPEAEVVPGTEIVRLIPETPEEVFENNQKVDTGGFGRRSL